jgi:hypothetical protein
MARDLFIDLTNRRLVASETNSAPVGLANFTKGDNGAFNLYFLEATGVINRPFEVVDKSSTSVKLGIGSRLGVPETGTYTLTFGGNTTSALDAAATAGAIQTALNGLSAISSAGGVSVTGELSDHFTVRFTTAGTQGSITANVSQLIPDTVAVIEIGDTVSIEKSFATGNTTTSLAQELAIEGIQHQIDVSSGHRITLFTSPTTLVFELVLDDLIYGITNSTNVLG